MIPLAIDVEIKKFVLAPFGTMFRPDASRLDPWISATCASINEPTIGYLENIYAIVMDVDAHHTGVVM